MKDVCGDINISIMTLESIELTVADEKKEWKARQVREEREDAFIIQLSLTCCVMTVVILIDCLFAGGVLSMEKKTYYCSNDDASLNRLNLTCCVQNLTDRTIFCVPARSKFGDHLAFAVIAVVISGLLGLLLLLHIRILSKSQIVLLLFWPIAGVVANLVIILV